MTFTELSQSLCFVILAVCFGLLSWWKRNIFQSGPERCRAGYHQGFLCILLPSFGPDQSPSFCCPSSPGHPAGQVMRDVWIPPDLQYVWHSGQRSQTLSHHTREFCFSWSENPSAAFWQTSDGLFVSLLRSGLCLSTGPYRPDRWSAAEMIVFQRFFSFCTATLETLLKCPLSSLAPPWHRPFCLQLPWKCLSVSIRLPLSGDGGHSLGSSMMQKRFHFPPQLCASIQSFLGGLETIHWTLWLYLILGHISLHM